MHAPTAPDARLAAFLLSVFAAACGTTSPADGPAAADLAAVVPDSSAIPDLRTETPDSTALADMTAASPLPDLTAIAPPPDLTAVSDLTAIHDLATAPDMGRDYSSNRALFFGASRCAQAKVELCEDFESGTIDKNVWQVLGTAPVIDGIQVARGAKALHITLNGNGRTSLKETKTFPAVNNTYYGRMFVYFQSLPADTGNDMGMSYSHWTFAAASGTKVSGEIRLSGQLQNKLNHFGVGTDNRVDPDGTGDWTTSDNDPKGKPNPVPTKEWICIEWMHKGDTNETRFYWDAVEHPSMHTTPTMHGGNQQFPYILPQFNNVWVGFQEYQTSTEKFELWIDEIAIDKDRIGCIL